MIGAGTTMGVLWNHSSHSPLSFFLFAIPTILMWWPDLPQQNTKTNQPHNHNNQTRYHAHLL
jgi:hypothetical protein